VDRAFSDTASVPTASMALVDLRAQISVCKVTGPKAGVPSLATALAVAHGLLSGHVPGGKLAGLISGATLTNAEVNEFSLAGLAKGQLAWRCCRSSRLTIVIPLILCRCWMRR
jgi:hypothetical protein